MFYAVVVNYLFREFIQICSCFPQHLLIPMDKEIHVYSAATWDVKFTLGEDNLKEVGDGIA